MCHKTAVLRASKQITLGCVESGADHADVPVARKRMSTWQKFPLA